MRIVTSERCPCCGELLVYCAEDESLICGRCEYGSDTEEDIQY